MDPEVFTRAAQHVFYAHPERAHLLAATRSILDCYASLSPHPKGFSSCYPVFSRSLTDADPFAVRTLDLLIMNRLFRVAEGSGNGSGIDRHITPDERVIEWHARYSSLLTRSEN